MATYGHKVYAFFRPDARTMAFPSVFVAVLFLFGRKKKRRKKKKTQRHFSLVQFIRRMHARQKGQRDNRGIPSFFKKKKNKKIHTQEEKKGHGRTQLLGEPKRHGSEQTTRS